MKSISPRRHPASNRGRGAPKNASGSLLLIICVWIIELGGSVIGVGSAANTTFGDALPATLAGWLLALPMLMLPFAEVLRVPIMSAMFIKKPMGRFLAIVGLIIFSYPAVENFSIGFDRIAEKRVEQVVALETNAEKAKADLVAAESEYRERQSRSSAKRAELRTTGTASRDQNIAAMDSRLKAAHDAHDNKTEIRELRARTRAEQERQEFTNKIDQLVVKDDEAEVAKFGVEKHRLGQVVAEAEKQLREARAENFLYRFATYFSRAGNISDLSPSDISFARSVFAFGAALVCAMAGPLGAFVHYSSNRTPGAPSFIGGQVAKLIRTRRAYLARRRKSLPVSYKNIVDFVRLRSAAEEAKPNQIAKGG